MVQPDKFGRTWKGRKIVWIRSTNCSRKALYKWITVYDDGKSVQKLVYDKKSGMCDKQGYSVKETQFEIVPALEGKTEGTWERFPDTEDAYNFKKTLDFNTYSAITDTIVDVNEFDNEYNDEEIVIY